MPTGSYPMTSSFSYRRLKKLPSSSHPPEEDEEDHSHSSTTLQTYHTYYRAALAALTTRRRRRRRRARGTAARPRLRVASLARALRRVGGRVRASVAKVAARLREGRPYVADLFAGNYMFLQVAPTTGGGDKGFAVPFTEYYYGKVKAVAARPAVAVAAGVPAGQGQGVVL